jgi:hypothetical protein
MKTRLCGIGALVLFGLAAVSAQEMPKPAPEMAQLDSWEGTWSCEGTMNPSPMGPGGKTTSSVRIYDDLGGFFQSGTVKSTMAGTPPLEGMFHTTYDPGMKQFVMMWFDNSGAWAQSTSRGWQGDTMTFEGDQHMGGKTMKGRDRFVRSGTNTLKHVFEMQADGKWTSMGEETCRKTGR